MKEETAERKVESGVSRKWILGPHTVEREGHSWSLVNPNGRELEEVSAQHHLDPAERLPTGEAVRGQVNCSATLWLCGGCRAAESR